MRLGISLSLTQPLGGFSPASLFSGGQQGAWYDPSDLNTLFQDAAGTTPVTAAGQPVGRILDKSGRGNHATQATAASRPTYGVVPATGQRNLALFSEPSQDSETSARSNITYVAGFDGFERAVQFGDNSVNRWAYVGPALQPSAVYTVSVFVRMDDGGAPVLGPTSGADFRLVAGNRSTDSGAVTHLGGGLYRCHAPITTTTGSLSNTGVLKFTSNSARGFRVTGYQIELGDVTPTAYQRTNGQFNVTEAGVQSLSYLSFDGVDDFLVTGTITPGTDKVQVFAGVRKLSDAAAGMLVESSASASLNAGSFYVSAPDTAGDNYRIRAGGSIRPFTALLAPYASPISNVLTGLSDIAGDSLTARINGSVVETVTSDQGTGNFLAYPLYIGRRGGTTLPFNGQLYSLIVRFGANLDANTISNTETWVNGRTGAY